MVCFNNKKEEAAICNGEMKDFASNLSRLLPDEVAYLGTSKGVNKDRQFISDKVIFVDNLPKSFKKNEFVDLFKNFGKILDVKLLKHKTGSETSYGFVEFAEEENGKRAINELHWKMLESRNIRVSRAKLSSQQVSVTNLYVENIPKEWKDDNLYSYFRNICEITSARVLINRKNEVSQGVGFVHCVNNEEAKKAVKWIRGGDSGKHGLELKIKFAKIPRLERKAHRERIREAEASNYGNINKSMKFPENMKPKLQKEENTQLQENPRWKDHSKSLNNGVQLRLDSVGGMRKNHKQKAQMRKHDAERNMQSRQRSGRLDSAKIEKDWYSYHLENYACQPPLLWSGVKRTEDMMNSVPSPNRANFFNSGVEENIATPHIQIYMSNHPEPRHLTLDEKESIPMYRGKFSGSPLLENSSYCSCHHISSQDFSSPSGSFDHMSFSPFGRWNHISQRNNITGGYYTQPIMMAPIDAISRFPFCAMCSPPDLNQITRGELSSPDSNNIGRSNQLISPTSALEEDCFHCPNWFPDNKFVGNWNGCAPSRKICSGCPTFNPASHCLYHHLDNFSINDAESRSDTTGLDEHRQSLG